MLRSVFLIKVKVSFLIEGQVICGKNAGITGNYTVSAVTGNPCANNSGNNTICRYFPDPAVISL